MNLCSFYWDFVLHLWSSSAFTHNVHTSFYRPNLAQRYGCMNRDCMHWFPDLLHTWVSMLRSDSTNGASQTDFWKLICNLVDIFWNLVWAAPLVVRYRTNGGQLETISDNILGLAMLIIIFAIHSRTLQTHARLRRLKARTCIACMRFVTER